MLRVSFSRSSGSFNATKGSARLVIEFKDVLKKFTASKVVNGNFAEHSSILGQRQQSRLKRRYSDNSAMSDANDAANVGASGMDDRVNDELRVVDAKVRRSLIGDGSLHVDFVE